MENTEDAPILAYLTLINGTMNCGDGMCGGCQNSGNFKNTYTTLKNKFKGSNDSWMLYGFFPGFFDPNDYYSTLQNYTSQLQSCLYGCNYVKNLSSNFISNSFEQTVLLQQSNLILFQNSPRTEIICWIGIKY